MSLFLLFVGIIDVFLTNSRNSKNAQTGIFEFWGPKPDTILTERVREVIDLSSLLNELLAEIRKTDYKTIISL